MPFFPAVEKKPNLLPLRDFPDNPFYHNTCAIITHLLQAIQVTSLKFALLMPSSRTRWIFSTFVSLSSISIYVAVLPAVWNCVVIPHDIKYFFYTFSIFLKKTASPVVLSTWNISLLRKSFKSMKSVAFLIHYPAIFFFKNHSS